VNICRLCGRGRVVGLLHVSDRDIPVCGSCRADAFETRPRIVRPDPIVERVVLGWLWWGPAVVLLACVVVAALFAWGVM